MTPTEFGYQFDILYNNMTSNTAPPLNNYEKSVFLTIAQEEIVREYFSSITAGGKTLYDSDELRRGDMSTLIQRKTVTINSAQINFTTKLENSITQITISNFDPLMVLDEIVLFTKTVGGTTYSAYKAVIPLSSKDLVRISSKEHSLPPRNQAWKIPISPNSFELIVDPKTMDGYTIKELKIRYVDRPTPIIIAESGASGITIGGESATTNQECCLPSSMHYGILLRAVELAKKAYTGTITEN